MTNPQRRQALFALADARGNNPHGTRESADHEGRRLNAQRYETVDQMGARLDQRGGGTFGVPQLGEAPLAPTQAAPWTAGDLLGLAIGVGVLGAAAFLWVAGSKSPTLSAPEAPAAPLLPAPAPAPSPSSVVVVQAPAAPLPNPAPVRARRRRAKKPPDTATMIDVTVVPPST